MTELPPEPPEQDPLPAEAGTDAPHEPAKTDSGDGSPLERRSGEPEEDWSPPWQAGVMTGAPARPRRGASRPPTAIIGALGLLAFALFLGILTTLFGHSPAEPGASPTPFGHATPGASAVAPSPVATIGPSGSPLASASPTPLFSPIPILTPIPGASETPSPGATPTPSPTPAPTPSPTPAPTPTPALTLRIASVTSPVMRDAFAILRAQTLAGASCSIRVEYRNGPSTAGGLSARTAASNGVVSWTWQIERNAPFGSWPISVTCQSQGRSITRTTSITVTNK